VKKIPATAVWLTGVLFAALLEVPALATEASAAIASEGSLRKPPPTANPWPEKVRAAVRAIYPELFTTPSQVTTLVVIALNGDGSVYRNTKRALGLQEAGGGLTFQKNYDAIGVQVEDFQAIGAVSLDTSGSMSGDQDIGWSIADTAGTGNKDATPLIISYGVLYSTVDPARSSALVRSAVRQHYGDLVRRPHGATCNRVTVYMTAAGTIDWARVGTLNFNEAQPATLSAEDFLALGVTADRVGPVGQTVIRAGEGTRRNPSRLLLIKYAWPRRPAEAASQPVTNRFASIASDGGATLAIVDHYFPDEFTLPKSTPEAWVLLDHAGDVLRTGRFPTAGAWGQMSEVIRSQFPGIRIEQSLFGEIRSSAGKSAMIDLVWLKSDSPVPAPAADGPVSGNH
jgi:hypothetical protein